VARVVCIGGATVDRIYRSRERLRPGTSNPAHGTRSFGGVARNVAESLARLGAPVALVSAVGNDESGRALVAHLAALGVDTRAVLARPDRATAEYVAVTEPTGELALGLADMGILDTLTPDALPALADAALVFADCNLPPATLADLLARPRAGRLAVDAVSAPKARRLPADLTGLDLLFLNRDEARALLGEDLAVGAAASRLRAWGAGAVVVTDGAAGLGVADPEGVDALPAAPVAAIADVTGAGDALVAGTLRALVDERPLREALRSGLACAALALAHPGGVRPDLSPALLAAALDVP
jgi:pseudouridine kinase